MNELQLQITKLIGKKELKCGCLVEERWIIAKYVSQYANTCSRWIAVWTILTTVDELWEFHDFFDYKIIWYPATLSDLHRCIMWVKDTCWNNKLHFKQTRESIEVMIVWKLKRTIIIYDSSLDLLDQSEETLKTIIDLITSYR